jgi:biotin carboxyl carrier protein
MPTRRVEVRLGDQAVTVEVGDDARVASTDNTPRAIEIGPGEWQVTLGGQARRLYVAGPRDAPWIWYDGAAYRPEVIDPLTAVRVRRRDATGDLAAPMPATVRAIHVSAGDAVTRGQTLVVLEAMKMELPLKAPVDGTVVSVACRMGDLVQPGVPLVVIE